jgi:hypothetical protein
VSTATNEQPPVSDEDGAGEGLPPVRDAFIGLAIGILLLYVGSLFSSRLLRWPIIGVGVSFVLVMTAYIVANAWPTVSSPLRKLVSRARGHVRTFPQIGTLIRNVKAEAWEGSFTSGGRSVEFLIHGQDQPAAALVRRAGELIAAFPALERQLADYLAREATAETDAEIASEIRALRVATLFFDRPDRPDDVEIHLDGPDDMHYWTCKYSRGELTDLNFDNN